MVTRKIAGNGMRGRKKTTLLLTLVLAFTFLFIVAAILLETSMTETKKRQRRQLYGKWHASYMEASPEICERLSGEADVTRIAKTKVLGVDRSAGTVGTVTQELIDMGNLKLTDGRLPEAEDEILVEASAADNFGLSKPIGETVRISVQKSLVAEDMGKYLMQQYGESGYEGEEVLTSYERLSTFRKNFFDTENKENLKLILNSKYCCVATVEQVKDSGYIQNNGLLYEQDIKVEGEYKIVGVIQSYSAFWDVGTYCLPNLFLSEEGGKKIEKALQTTALVDLSDLVFYADVFMESDTQGEHLNEKLEKRYGSGNAQESDSSRVIRRNQYAYPESTEGSETMITFLVVIVIFVVAFCAILQIFLTQIKKRTRKIALLKSIGATGGQVVSMMLWEGIYLLCYSMPIGVAAGFIVGWGAVQFLHIVMGMDTAFYMNPKLVGYGILMGCFALFAGMTVPTIKAVRVPLVGAITVTEKNRRKKSVRERIGAKQGDRKQRLTFAAVSKSHERLNWKNRIVTGIIAVVTSILLFSALYLGYLAFGTYREAVVEDNRPDYVLSASHGYQDFEVKNIAKSIEAEKKGSRVETYQRLNKVCLLYDRIDESPLLTAYKKYLPKERYAEFIGSKPTGRDALRGYGDLSMVLGGVQTTAYGFDIYGDMYKNIKEMLTVGELDENAFIKGDSVILAVPLYTEPNGNKKAVKSVPETVTDDEMFSYVLEELGGYQLSYDKKDKRKMQRDISIQPGDRVHLSVERQELTDGSQPPVSYDTWDVCVDGIIYYTPDEKIYPHFTYENGFMILGSTGLLYKISMATRFNPLEWYTPEQFEFILTQCPTKFGETYINVHTDDKANAVESATKIMKLGKGWNMEFNNYNEENWNLYYRALNTALILGVFGVTSVMIVMLILWNIHMSAFEQERGRIGVLQALGVTNREFAMRYLTNGIKTGVMALGITHILLGTAILVSGEGLGAFVGYPWMAHILLCLVYLALVVAVGCGPIRELQKYAPNENIMS